jgi:hypothetical protein
MTIPVSKVLVFRKEVECDENLEIEMILLFSNCLPHSEFDVKKPVTQLWIASDIA